MNTSRCTLFTLHNDIDKSIGMLYTRYCFNLVEQMTFYAQ